MTFQEHARRRRTRSLALGIAWVDQEPPNLLALQLDRCKSYTSRSSLVLPKQGWGVFSELEFIIMLAQIKTKLCFPFLKAHCRPLSLYLQFYSKGIPVTLGNFLVSSQNQTVMLPIYT